MEPLQNSIRNVFSLEQIGMRLQPDIIWRIPIQKGEKKISLTFDDGPYPESTYPILDLLEKYSVRATFFVTGGNLELHPLTAQTVASQGHHLANHGWSHKLSLGMTSEKFRHELLQLEDLAYTKSIPLQKYYRPPYGIMTRKQFVCARDIGYQVVVGDVYPYDAQEKSSKFIINYALRRIIPGSIIILHDGIPSNQGGKYKYNTLEALGILLPRLIDDGYQFVDSSGFSV
jgi:peptidoglycan/xylan/chitin deacetylase (PgdA/CDA1 family)